MNIVKNDKVLVVDDNPIDLALLKVHLENMGLRPLLAQDSRSAIETAIKEQPILILLDKVMPDVDGFEICKKLKTDMRTSAIPVIFISADEQLSDKVAGLNIGAIDYITKPFDPSELKARIGIVRQMIELQKKLLSLANTDELTGMLNRRRFFDILEREILQGKIEGKPLALMILDIDNFKKINDTYGHPEGDMILKKMGQIFEENLYPLDVSCRWGGEEFTILLPRTSPENSVRVAEKLRKIIDNYQWQVSDKYISVTVSIGLANLGSENITDSSGLIKKADDALYAAKRSGKNCVITAEQLDAQEQVPQPRDRDYNELQAKISSLREQLRTHVFKTISALTKTMDIASNDTYLSLHGENVMVYADAIAEELGLSSELRERIATSARLHDFGKISIPSEILQKDSPLTQEDWATIKKHPAVSVDILSSVGLFDMELNIIRHHHENFDGTGYPDGLKGKEIPIGARIITVADTFDAITSDRYYRPAQTIEYAIDEIIACSRSQFDPEVVNAFQSAYQKHKQGWPLSKKESLVNTV
ncbi:diguanylate cyclase [Planctomycetota bacterium]